ncbi:hypothetical protein MLD52_10220 [Puniceicoccaceae bacterium K14]|nr:hypothetical protein [Puniceicoccaceae bacterium K14]
MGLAKFIAKLPWLGAKKTTALLFDEAQVRSQLREATATLESVFGNLSENIIEIDSRTESLKNHCHTLLELAGGHNNGTTIILEAAQALEDPMQYIEESLDKRRDLKNLMSVCEKITNTLLHRQNEMIEKLKPLKFMLVFYKIEAANLTAEHQSTFITVSDEFLRLHTMVDKTFRENIEKLTDAKSRISRAVDNFVQEHNNHTRQVKRHRNIISDTISSLNRQLSENSLQNTDLHYATEHFQSALEKLVIALQTEDIFRQRCQHIEDSLDNKPNHLSNLAWALLNSRKIDAAAREMREASKQVDESLKAILTQANELNDISVSMKQFKHMTASADGMIQILLDSFDGMYGIFKHSEKLSSDAQEAVSPVKSLVSGLSVIVNRVSINIQFIALNAQVKSIQVGEGSGLEVLAARTAEISTELKELGDETEKDIEKMQLTVEKIAQLIDEDRKSSANLAGNLGEHDNSNTQNLHNLRNDTFNTLNHISETLNFVKNFLEKDRDKLDEFPLVASSLEGIAQSILEVSGISKLDATELALLEEEIVDELIEAEKTSHTSLNAHKETSLEVFDRNADDSEIVNTTGDVELF